MTDSVLIIQTAFAGDLVLTTPLIEAAAVCLPGASIDVLCIPTTENLLRNNPRIRHCIAYDKRGGERLTGVLRRLSRIGYDLCLTPHRSMRSALLARASRAPLRVSFDRSAGGPLHTHRVPYDPKAHEVRRNLSLLAAIGCSVDVDTPPRVYPGEREEVELARILDRLQARAFVCVAPGSVWPTKRWTTDGFINLVRMLLPTHAVVLLGGADDRVLCSSIAAAVNDVRCISVAGELSWLASAALLRAADVLISNDSAPVHIASAVGTPVVEIYGATSPAFGFTPFAVRHRIVEVEGLDCKPCAIHGGERCPQGHFACMTTLQPGRVYEAAMELLAER